MKDMHKDLVINYEEHESIANLDEKDRALLQCAIEATEGAYAPYSGFRVGAALRLRDGSVVVGSNQENVAYPSGLCAERTAIFAASAQRADCREYEALAIVGRDTEGHLCEASPCGACRQVLSEYEHRQGFPMRVVCLLEGGGARVFPSVASLLPFSFNF